jgi:hypothetical protein
MVVVVIMLLRPCRGDKHRNCKDNQPDPHALGPITVTVCIMPPCMW